MYGADEFMKISKEFLHILRAIKTIDGVYYCDIRPNMQTEDILKEHIKTFDNLLIEDMRLFT
jgi:hypothetical protein